MMFAIAVMFGLGGIYTQQRVTGFSNSRRMEMQSG